MLTSDFDYLRTSLHSADDLLEDRFMDRWGKSYDQILKEYAATTPFYTSEKSRYASVNSSSSSFRPYKICYSCFQAYYYDKCSNPSCKLNQDSSGD